MTSYRFWTGLFFIVLAAHILCIRADMATGQYIFKPLIIPALCAWFFFQTRETGTSLKKWIVAALFFSWAGDILLMFVPRDEVFFLAGLASFLLAHIFYILFFHFTRLREGVQSRVWLLLPVVLYYVVFISWLSPWLDDMKIPVRVYGIVISFMWMLALHMLFIRHRKAGRWMAAGAFLFVVSDSLLAVNKFYTAFEGAGELIMLTYGLAQWGITRGAVQYIRQANSR